MGSGSRAVVLGKQSQWGENSSARLSRQLSCVHCVTVRQREDHSCTQPRQGCCQIKGLDLIGIPIAQVSELGRSQRNNYQVFAREANKPLRKMSGRYDDADFRPDREKPGFCGKRWIDLKSLLQALPNLTAMLFATLRLNRLPHLRIDSSERRGGISVVTFKRLSVEVELRAGQQARIHAWWLEPECTWR